jgi:hypothetical protein
MASHKNIPPSINLKKRKQLNRIMKNAADVSPV